MISDTIFQVKSSLYLLDRCLVNSDLPGAQLRAIRAEYQTPDHGFSSFSVILLARIKFELVPNIQKKVFSYG